MDRRDFLKIGGAATLALAAAGCDVTRKEGKAASAGEAVSPAGGGGMEYRTNPANGDKVSLLGYGCMRWPMTKDEDGKDVVDQPKVDALVDHAISHGVNYFDTSPAYLQGQSERASAKALCRHPRGSYYLATKLSNFNDASRKASLQMYHDSFEEMQTDYFDYYLLHSIGRGGYEAFKSRYEDNGMADFLVGEREAGRIRQLGFSFHGAPDEFKQMMDLHGKYRWDFVQIEMNYIDWRHADGVRNTNAEELYGQLDALGIPITVMEPLLGGRLANPPQNVARMLKERRPDDSISSWAFRFVGSHPRVLTVLSGMTYMEHLVDNLKTYCGFEPMTDEELELMEKVAVLMREYPTVNCTGCTYCMPCPYGIDIPGIFAHYNRMVNEGIVAKEGDAQKEYRRLRREYLVSYNKAISSVRQANHCIGCGQCVPHCPQSIRIPRELRRIDNYVERLKRSME